ncbi:hypothetical protein ACX0G9_08320 [Flavitalea flava]
MSTQSVTSNPAPSSSHSSYPKQEKNGSFIKIVLLAGLLAGTLDAISASISAIAQGINNPARVFIFVASVALGKSVLLTGGSGIAIVGLLIHFFIAYSFTLFFFLIYPKLPILAKNRVLTAVVYGLFVWIVMNLIVLPIAGRPFHFRAVNTPVNILILMFAIGLPVSFIAYRYFKKR